MDDTDKQYEINSDEFFMKEALKEARKAFDSNETPVGAVIVADNQVIARAHNSCEALNDATAHAELLAIGSASNALGSKFLPGATLFITVEPCIMCAGACYWARLKRIVWGAPDTKAGFTRTRRRIIHPSTKIKSGVLESECADMIREFFSVKR
jgi:tRNA(adenine34) deaminase